MLSLNHWHTEPALLIGLLAAVWLYGMLVGPWRRALDPEARFPAAKAGWFLGAVLSFYLAVGSPLDAAGENYLFSAHMLQHNIFMYVTTVMACLGLPDWLVDGVLTRLRLVGVARWLCHPVVAGLVFTVVFTGWHAPALYEAALRSRPIHMVEHLSMFGASLLMIWPLMGPSNLVPPIGYGGQAIYLFVTGVAQIPLFALLTFSSEVFYPTYELAPRLPWLASLDPLQDQVLGGLIMKVVGAVFATVFLLRAFYRWFAESEPPVVASRRAQAA